MPLRTIILIDEEKCDGCGQCIPACSEGALELRDGKARLISAAYCDGLGACVGECPQGAITLVQREVEPFDPQAVARAQQTRTQEKAATHAAHVTPPAQPRSQLRNWPVQLRLVPVRAPQYHHAHLLFTADCVPFVVPDFHQRFLAGRTVLVGCPKFDDGHFYQRKLTQIILQNDLHQLEVLYMEVPCCAGLVELARRAVAAAGKEVPLSWIRLGVQGKVVAAGPVDQPGAVSEAKNPRENSHPLGEARCP